MVGGGGGNGRSALEKMGEILGLFPLLDFFSLSIPIKAWP